MGKKPKTGHVTKHKKQFGHWRAFANASKQVWIFDSVDNDGHFRFATHRDTEAGLAPMDCKDLLTKIIHFSGRTWSEMDRGDHHYLSYDSLCGEAKERIRRLRLEDQIEAVFSIKLNGPTRVIGLRYDEKFIVKWYDPNHEFCPSSK
jgi:hypothetical protein